DENPTAYLGLTVPDFPNFFTMLGPNTGPAHGGSVIFQAECQSRYITACLIEMIERRIAAIDVDAGALDDYVARVDREHEQMIWTHPGMSTYYRNRHGPRSGFQPISPDAGVIPRDRAGGTLSCGSLGLRAQLA